MVVNVSGTANPLLKMLVVMISDVPTTDIQCIFVVHTVNDLGGDVKGGGRSSQPADVVVEEICSKGGTAIANYGLYSTVTTADVLQLNIVLMCTVALQRG